MSRTACLAVLLCLGTGLSGCALPRFLSEPPQVRGNKVDPEQIAQLVPGISTRADVTALIGSPTARATFDDNTWIYIGEVTQPVIAGTQTVRDLLTYRVVFDGKGVVRRVDRKTLSDSAPIDVVSRETPSPGSDASLLQQLLGNVGRFNPSGGVPGGRQGSSTNPGNF